MTTALLTVRRRAQEFVVMLYWLWRIRTKRMFRRVVGITAPEAI